MFKFALSHSTAPVTDACRELLRPPSQHDPLHPAASLTPPPLSPTPPHPRPSNFIHAPSIKPFSPPLPMCAHVCVFQRRMSWSTPPSTTQPSWPAARARTWLPARRSTSQGGSEGQTGRQMRRWADRQGAVKDSVNETQSEAHGRVYKGLWLWGSAGLLHVSCCGSRGGVRSCRGVQCSTSKP